MRRGRRLTVNGRRLTVNGKQLTVLVVSSVLLISFVTVAIATGFFGINTTKVSSLEKGLVAHYPLDGVYQTKDVTPYGNHGTNYGATLTTGIKDEPNGAYEFDGNDYINVQNSDIFNLTNKLTLSVWIKSNDFGSNYRIIALKFQSGRSFGLEFYNNKLDFSLSGDGVSWDLLGHLMSSNTLNDNVWHNVVATYDGTTASIYIDGVLNNTKSASGNMKITSSNITIGGQTGSEKMNGLLSDFRVYNRALSEDEIKLLFESYKPKASASDLNKGLVGHWMLDAENGAKDLTPYGNHGTANGGITIGGAEDRKGKSGGSTNFDGSNDYITIPNSPKLNPTDEISVSFWLKYNSLNNWVWFVSKNSDSSAANGYYFALYADSPSIRFTVNSVSAFFPVSYLKSNKWHFLTGTAKSGSVVRIYLDGVHINTSSSTTPSSFRTYGGYLGLNSAAYYTSPKNLKGQMQDVRIYNRAISEDEIKLLFDSYKPKEASVGNLNKGLVLDMPLTTKWMKSSTIVSDRTPYGNDGTVMNGAIVGEEGTTFDGVNDYIKVNNNNNFNFGSKNFSISFWTYRTSAGYQGGGYISKGTHQSPGFDAYDGMFKVYTSNGNLAKVSLSASFDMWEMHTFIVSQESSPYISHYINSNLDQSGYTDMGNKGSVTSSRDLIIGKSDAGDIARYFNGKISNVRIYNRALSDEEVKLLYEKGRW